MFKRNAKYPLLQISIVDGDAVELKVDWPKVKTDADAAELAEQVSKFFIVLDKGFALLDALRNAIIAKAKESKDLDIGEQALYLGDKYEEKVSQMHKKPSVKKDSVVVPATKTLEP